MLMTLNKNKNRNKEKPFKINCLVHENNGQLPLRQKTNLILGGEPFE